jgi:6-phosphogluconolactonase (cycloisomerase 2 family)
VQVWDNCGGVAKVSVRLTVNGQIRPAGFLYTVSSNYYFGNTVNSVTGFQLLSNGAIAPTGQSPVKANVFPISVASDKSGYRLYVADYISGDVFAYYIYRNDGYIHPVPGSPFPVKRSVTVVAVHPSGHFVYGARNERAAGDGIAVFAVQSNGSLVQIPGSPYSTETGPQAIAVDPNGHYLYVADGSGFIDEFTIDETSGQLTPLSGSPIALTTTKPACGPFPTDIIDYLSKRLYTANSFDDSISGFNITSTTGTISQISGSPWPDEGGCNISPGAPSAFNPESITIDGSGKFLYGVNQDTEEIAIYAIQANGALKFVKYTPNTSACAGPIRTDPKGNYLYTVGCHPEIVEFAINHTNGDLTPLPSSPMIVPSGWVQSFAVTP